MQKIRKTGLAWTAKVFRSEKGEFKLKLWGNTWMWCSRGTVGWSSFNQGWFKSRAVSSRKQKQKVSALGKATTLGFICRKRRMRVALRSTSPLFFAGLIFFSQTAIANSQPAVTVAVADAVSVRSAVERKAPPLAPRNERLLEAARMYEKYFLGQMTKAMRSTVSFSELSKPSMGERIYREQLDDQYVDAWTERGGIGLANMIHDQMAGKMEMAKLLRQTERQRQLNQKNGAAPTGLAFSNRDVLNLRRLPSAPGTAETVLVSLGRTQSRPSDPPEVVFTPWAGRVEAVTVSGDSKATKRSQISLRVAAQGAQPARQVVLAFDGVPLNVTEGDSVIAGQSIGQLAPAARGLLVRQTIVQTD